MSFSVVSGPATISTDSTNSSLNLTGVGQVKISASQSGGGNYLPAPTITRSLNVAKGTQSITFNPPSPVAFVRNGTFALGATDSSGLQVTFTSGNPKVLSISGSTATMKSKGSVRITASQSGNANYYPATSVAKSINLH